METRGLSSAEALQRLHVAGANEMPQAERRGLLRVAAGVLAEPMFLLLVLAASLYLLFGDLAEGVMLAVFAMLTVGLVVIQQTRSENALEALRALGAPMARVVRDGSERSIAARDLVPGDTLLVGEGERVAADALLRRCDQLSLDESLLTGESVPVRKRADRSSAPASAIPGGDDLPWIFAGTLVVRGHGVAEVMHTGASSQAGRIGVALASIRSTSTPLQQTIGRLVRMFGLIALVASAALVLLYGLIRDDWLEGTLAGIAFAMAMLPEEFPMAMSVFLAIGAWRLAKLKVLVRRPEVIETLGAASVLCVDKTGTLTQNQMRLHTLSAAGAIFETGDDPATVPAAFHDLLEVAVLASKRQAIDPMDVATVAFGRTALQHSTRLHDDWILEREFGVSHELPALSRVWRRTDGHLQLSVKGAPEAIARLCRLNSAASATLLGEVERFAKLGLRVLAVASSDIEDAAIPEDPHAVPMRLHGLLAFEDPLRPSATAAVAQARDAGIVVAMITGDHPETALAIARAAGIDVRGGAVTGVELEHLGPAELLAAVVEKRVFARIRPEQKLRLVEAFKSNGAVVAMTGDGVNDAPALKAAHIGLAMGTRATDVAREAAGIVLLDDDFGDLVAGVRQGRRIFDNLRKVLIYIAAVHVPIAGLAIIPILLGMPPLLLPGHVVLIEMVIDPICSIAFENNPAEADIMKRPPRDPRQLLIGWPQLSLAMTQGILLLAATLGLYVVLRNFFGTGEDEARALSFVALTAGNLMLVRVNGTRLATFPELFASGHRAFWLIAMAAATVVAACLFVPTLSELFRFGRPEFAAILLAALLGSSAVLAFDLLKRLPIVQRAIAGNEPDISQ
jgi:P-type Ca2+ transporter type 2C